MHRIKLYRLEKNERSQNQYTNLRESHILLTFFFKKTIRYACAKSKDHQGGIYDTDQGRPNPTGLRRA